jgi:ribosomal protein S18 acetylase RimI-like enzyme
MVVLEERVGPEAQDQVAGVFARAFFEDPFYTYVIPDPERRRRHMTWWMASLTLYGLRQGRIDAALTPDDQVIRGAALWVPPEGRSLDLPEMARVGLLRVPFRLGLRSFLRTLEITGAWDRVHAQQPPHWYLMMIGVEPAYQGRGAGSALMSRGLALVDAQAMPCYLETMTPRNVVFYRRYGFETVAEGTIKNGARFWAMRRPPLGGAG